MYVTYRENAAQAMRPLPRLLWSFLFCKCSVYKFSVASSIRTADAVLWKVVCYGRWRDVWTALSLSWLLSIPAKWLSPTEFTPPDATKFDIFYRAMHYSTKRGLAIECRLSVCPSVRPSVTSVDHDHIGSKSWKLIARTISPTSSLLVAQRSSTYSQGNYYYYKTFWETSGGVGKSGVLEHKSGNISDKAHRVVIFAITQLSCWS